MNNTTITMISIKTSTYNAPVLTSTIPICARTQFCIQDHIIGSFMTVITIPVILLILLVIYAQFKSGNLAKNGYPIFILSTWSLLSSIIILLIIGCYVGPTIILQTTWPDAWFLQTFSYNIAQILLAMIFSGSLFNNVIAINRALVMSSINTNMIFSRKIYNIIAMIIFPLGFIVSYLPQIVFSCCKSYYSFTAFAILMINFKFDPSTGTMIMLNQDAYNFVYRPFYVISTIIPIICYTYIFGYLFWMRKQTTMVATDARGELIRSLLFAMVFFFYMCSWLYYDLVLIDGIITPSSYTNTLSLIFIMLEAMMNGILQATMITSVMM